MRKKEFSKLNKETVIKVGGSIAYTSILEDYNNRTLDGEKKSISLNDFVGKFFYTDKCWIRCKSCGSLVTAGSKNKQRCNSCNIEHYNKYHKNYYNTNKSFYLYVIEDKDSVKRYAGITTSLSRRSSEHINGRVSGTKELFKNNNWKCFKYVDLADIVNDENELKVLENTMMCDLNTYKNSDSIKYIDKKRREELLEEFKYHDFKIYKENIN